VDAMLLDNVVGRKKKWLAFSHRVGDITVS